MSRYWNDDWRDELQSEDNDVYLRLCNCKNIKKDILIMSKLVVKYNSDKSKEECLDHIIEWVSDLNNQVNLIPDDDEYKRLISRL